MVAAPQKISFQSRATRCTAWHLRATTEALAGPHGRPAIVMANGFGGTVDTGLLDFVQPFAEAGFDVIAFDYRGFGTSDGLPRQNISVRQQRQDYHAAIALARRLSGIDADRIALWGTSYSGGHAIVVAAQDGRVGAVVSMNPATDGMATLRLMLRHAGLGKLISCAWHGLRDALRAAMGRTPHLVPIVGGPRSTALMTAPGAEAAYLSLAGPTWRNEVCARAALEVGLNRPTTYARRLPCPLLLQLGTNDRIAPPDAARRAARKARDAQIEEYPIDHFDFYAAPWVSKLLTEQITFLVATIGRPLTS